MPGMQCGLDPKMLNKGFIIRTDENCTPELVPCPPDYSGIEPDHCLFIMALDIRYKFFCEDFQDKFETTGNFIKAWIQKEHNSKAWFKSPERKMLDSNPKAFLAAFKKTLTEDLDSYYGTCAQDLVLKMKKELDKLEL